MPEATHPIPEPPEIVGGRYLLGKAVGAGSSGAVYLARDRDSGERFAVKIREAKEREQPVRFIAEAQDMKRLRHPRLVPVLDYGNDGKLYWYTMPYYPNGCIRDRVKEQGPIPPVTALDWTFQVLEGLQAVHQSGLVHRDVKPHNVLLDDHDQALLTDFGLVRHVHGGVPYRTRTDQSMGTPNYRAPEQAVDAANVDVRADIYGVGATLYYVLSSRRPGFLYMVNVDDPTLESVVPILRPFVLKCMAYDPAERFPDARACAEEVARLVDLLPDGMRPSSPLGPVWTRRFDRGARQGLVDRVISWWTKT